MSTIDLATTFHDQPSLEWFVFANVVVTGLLSVMILLTETLNTFLNPLETTVLAHQPIQEQTYFAAKITYLLGVVASIVFPLNIVAALCGLNFPESRWFFPITYLLALYLLGVSVALGLCAIVGLLFRIVPHYRLRSIATFIQAGLFITLFQYPRLAHSLTSLGLTLAPALNPVEWFVWLATVGQTKPTDFHWTSILLMLFSGMFVVFGVRSLSKGYLTTVHLLLKGSKAVISRQEWRGSLIRLITGMPSGRAAFSFIYSMAKSDWQFRLSVLPVLIQFLILPVIAVARGLGPSPFGSGRPTLAYLLPHIAGLVGLPICGMMTYSDQHRAA
jgi:hypothetical protein